MKTNKSVFQNQRSFRKSLSVLAFLALFTALNAAAAEYDLSAYLAKVEQNNPDLAIALKEVELAASRLAEARAAFFPSAGL